MVFKKLSLEQEKEFWDIIIKGLSKKLHISGKPSEWDKDDIDLINDNVVSTLVNLSETDKRIEGACNLRDEKGKLKNNYRSTIRKISRGLFYKTEKYTKNRFTYFLEGVSFDAYIKNKGLFKQPDSSDENSFSAFDSNQEKSNLSWIPFINERKYNAVRINNKIKRYPQQKEAQDFLLEFNDLHKEFLRFMEVEKDSNT
ncbi:MAG: hypothetical protein AAFZ15_18625, partial [Bacteroidota bacterium]